MKSLDCLTHFHKGASGAPPSNTIASSPPPPTQQSVEVQQAQRDAARQAAKRRGMDKTILAGETGGYQPVAAGTTLLGNTNLNAPKTTLLGGG